MAKCKNCGSDKTEKTQNKIICVHCKSEIEELSEKDKKLKQIQDNLSKMYDHESY